MMNIGYMTNSIVQIGLIVLSYRGRMNLIPIASFLESIRLSIRLIDFEDTKENFGQEYWTFLVAMGLSGSGQIVMINMLCMENKIQNFIFTTFSTFLGIFCAAMGSKEHYGSDSSIGLSNIAIIYIWAYLMWGVSNWSMLNSNKIIFDEMMKKIENRNEFKIILT